MPLTAEQIARVCHEANRAYTFHVQDVPLQSHWDEYDVNARQGTIEGVRNVLTNPDVTPQQSHESWLRFKKQEGWVYGPSLDYDKKTHPGLVDWFALPDVTRRKNSLFIAIIKALA